MISIFKIQYDVIAKLVDSFRKIMFINSSINVFMKLNDCPET